MKTSIELDPVALAAELAVLRQVSITALTLSLMGAANLAEAIPALRINILDRVGALEPQGLSPEQMARFKVRGEAVVEEMFATIIINGGPLVARN